MKKINEKKVNVGQHTSFKNKQKCSSLGFTGLSNGLTKYFKKFLVLKSK